MDINLASSTEDVKYDKTRAILLTYLSFPPLFGWIVGIISLNFQLKRMKNSLHIGLSILGTLFSLTLTALMIIGFALKL